MTERGQGQTPAGAPPVEGASSRAGGWEPLRYADFRRLWLAQFTSNVGSWMQTVAAQWVMTSLTRSALLLSAISAAGSIPILLLAVPAGTLGDLLDRRRLILVSQLVMLVAAAVLAVLSAEAALTPVVLLALLFLIGVGGAVSAPTWQTLAPEFVPAPDRPQAIALGSVNQNLARAVGPAIGGVLLAATSAALVFGVNAISFVAVLGAVALTVVPVRALTMPREHAFAAVRAGGRYVANSPALLALLARAVAFIFPAGALWALLPLVARQRLGLGSAGYGLLLGCVGLGALLAATLGPALRDRLAPRVLYALACAMVAAAAGLLAVTHTVALAVVALVVAGAAWILGLGLLGAAYQGQLPGWVKARGLSYYLVAFQGANGIGALALGGVAQASSVSTALVVLGVALAVAVPVTWLVPMSPALAGAVLSDEPLPVPALGSVQEGPVAVAVAYHLAPGQADAFLAQAADLRRARRRTGAIHWHLHRDLEDPDRFDEQFIVGSWEEHERQHDRLRGREREILDRIDALLAPGETRTARHSVSVRPPRRAKR
ncbi:MAG TPA: MFS transporter [Solirubrobacteraceae bacterium]|nr:MFS transporter [Solirubrobacteraceae bacterium]